MLNAFRPHLTVNHFYILGSGSVTSRRPGLDWSQLCSGQVTFLNALRALKISAETGLFLPRCL